jgi:hypothetical protein
VGWKNGAAVQKGLFMRGPYASNQYGAQPVAGFRKPYQDGQVSDQSIELGICGTAAGVRAALADATGTAMPSAAMTAARATRRLRTDLIFDLLCDGRGRL